MPTNPELRISGNSDDAIRAIAALERKYDNLENKIKRTGDVSKNANFKASGGLKDHSDSVVTLIGKYVTLTAAIQLASKAVEDMRERGKEALDTQTNLQGGVEALAINTMGFENFPLDKALAAVDRIVKEHGPKGGKQTVMKAMNEAFNALGGLTPEEGVRAVETTMKLIPNMPDAHAGVAAGILDIRQRRPDLSEEEAAGFMMMGMKQTRVKNLEAFSENALPGILKMADLDQGAGSPDIFGNAPLHAALTQATTDKHGRKSTTAGIALALQMRDFFGRDDAIDAIEPGQVVQQHNQGKALAETIRAKDILNSRWATAHNTVEENLKAAGVGWFRRSEASAGLMFGRAIGYSPEEAANKAATIEYNRAAINANIGGIGMQPDKHAKEMADNLRQLVNLTQRMVDQRRISPNAQIEGN